MIERTGGADRGIAKFTSVVRRKVESARNKFTGATAAENNWRSSLLEARERALENPTYRVLKANVDFQNWQDGKKVRGISFLEDDFTHIRNGIPVNPYQTESVWHERVIDPALDRDVLKEKCTDYCRETSTRFIETATSMARLLSSGDEEPSQEAMLSAIKQLIGTIEYDENDTIFKDQSWNVADYTPDFMQLDVDLQEAGISEEKIMAGVELCIGLWVRLADVDAKRPVSGKNFGPPTDHCSFLDLVDRSGWAHFTDSREILRDAVRNRSDEQGNIRERFYSQFRNPNFFQKTYVGLTRPDISPDSSK